MYNIYVERYLYLSLPLDYKHVEIMEYSSLSYVHLYLISNVFNRCILN